MDNKYYFPEKKLVFKLTCNYCKSTLRICEPILDESDVQSDHETAEIVLRKFMEIHNTCLDKTKQLDFAGPEKWSKLTNC